MSTPSGAAAPVFSYAQAAKGLTPSTSSQPTPRNESPAASEKTTRERSATESNISQPAAKLVREKSETDARSNTETAYQKSSNEDNSEKDTSANVQKALDVPESSSEQPNLSGNESSQDTKKEETRPQLTNGRTPSFDQASEISGQGSADKKPKDSEDDWEKISVPSMTAEKELKAAPIPVVNIWQQRREAQAARLKEIADQQRTAPSNTPKPTPSHDDPKRRSMSRDMESREREGKATDIPRANSRKEAMASRSSKDRADTEAPPSVADAQAWPTPDNSLVEERRRSSAYDKGDRTENKGGSQTKWKTMPFVPTAKFETQLPAAAARRGGRGGGRGRDPTGRGGHASSSEKQDLPGSMGPPPLPKQTGEQQDRGRRSEGQRLQRAGSVPTTSTRPESIDDVTPSFRKPAAPASKEQSVGDEYPPQKTEQSSRSSSRHTGQVGGRNVNGEAGSPSDQAPGSFGQPTEQGPRYPFSFDRFKSSGNSNPRGNGEFARERGSGRNRDWSRDKPETAREKVESWRDRDSSGDQSNRREVRPERARGGGFRGRGNHAFGTPYNSSHAYTAPLPQNGFETRSSSHTESRTRQTSQPFQPTQTPSGSRNNPRSQSIPVGMMFPGYYPGMSPGLPALQTDMAMYGYTQPMQMQPGIMSAMPFNDPLNSYALLSMVMTQIEYYFSIDNLCKDLFLRKHMDGQGYVPLRVIANFKRIKTLTEDNMTIDTLRYVCQQVKSVEFFLGADGDDRLRRRDGWRDFVLPEEERFEDARNDGPQQPAEQHIRSPQYEQPAPFEPSFSMGQMRSPAMNVPTTNGMFHPASPMPFVPGAQVDGHVPFPASFEGVGPEDISNVGYNSRAAPMRSPPAQAGGATMGGLVNGHHRQASRADIEENVFPDEEIPNINIRMQPHASLETNKPADDTPAAPTGTGESDADQKQTRIPSLSLRGGAGSPQLLETIHNLSFGTAATVSLADSVTYFTKDGHETQLPPPLSGQYDQSYQSVHDMAFQQRLLGIDGALEPLYSFWSDFLVDKFNVGMYEEFKSTASADIAEGSASGMNHLIRYYGKVLSGPIPVSERLAADMVQLSRQETDVASTLLHTLRGAWRNGATNMKTIKRLGDVLTAEEKTELDKSG
ncbi:uncharacterized protein PV06_05333 [Exophiala oligosperma]|uniref:HTH La-type RNA-binding domain-containing protein n=2 Tax=Exophiala oligosperma TaxID=215243 RepID=A0A0D2DP44_9EURO|nr:uncharacterized protein PV06_05333 [Exophiala oligosperma]KIW44315.1 hypothetical protein PV06_05333 [Exophiala oligosperma]